MSGVYQTLTASLAAGEQRALNITGRFFSIIDGNHPDIRVRIDDSAEMAFDEGLRFRMPDGQMFKKVGLVNKSGSTTLDFTVAYGTGYFDDSRLSLVGGALPVEPAGANNPFKVMPSDTNPPFKVEQTGYLNTEGGVMRQLKGTRKSKFGMVAGEYFALFTAGENTGGAIVHFMSLWAGSAAGSMHLIQSGVTQAVYSGGTSHDVPAMFVPAGNELQVFSSVAGGQVVAHVEFL